MSTFDKIFGKIEEIIAGICLTIMSILAFTNVLARYFFHASFSFSDEITTYLFVLLSLIGASIAAKRHEHLGFTVIEDLVPPTVKKILNFISYLMAVIFTSIIFYYGILMVISQYTLGQKTAGMQWSEWIFGSFVPIGSFFVLIRFLQILIHIISGKNRKDERKALQEQRQKEMM
ncbi:TRAP transporter small permease [uncultured Megamonas sp.]|uniref:TRAP transporter small permease n=1 Tax=uncultured Megamonas sp. TaxID=286140 RepID=UPI0025E467F9|nr:TRAP transporter small permease [uncultured Megamonas sp.]